MKFVVKAIFLLFLCMIYAPATIAQNGAVITSQDMEVLYIEWEGDTVAYFANSLGLKNLCGIHTDPYYEVEFKFIEQPNGITKRHVNGDYFIHVHYPASLTDIISCGDPNVFVCACDYWESGSNLVAEGIVHSNYISTNGKNVEGYTLSGTLTDVTGVCDSDMVDLNLIRQFKYDKKAESWFVHLMKGPRLECTE
jgi:hypothetical protein